MIDFVILSDALDAWKEKSQKRKRKIPPRPDINRPPRETPIYTGPIWRTRDYFWPFGIAGLAVGVAILIAKLLS